MMTKMIVRPQFDLHADESMEIVVNLMEKVIKDLGLSDTIDIMKKLIEEKEFTIIKVFIQRTNLKNEMKGKLEAELDIQLMKKLFMHLQRLANKLDKELLEFFPDYLPSIFNNVRKYNQPLLKRATLYMLNSLMVRGIKLPDVLANLDILLDGTGDILEDVIIGAMLRDPNSKAVLEAGLLEKMSRRCSHYSGFIRQIRKMVGMNVNDNLYTKI